MRIHPSIAIGSAIGVAAGFPASAAELAVKLELPEITTGMYMRPYVSIFIEKSDDSFVRSLSLWHMIENKRRGGGPPGMQGMPGAPGAQQPPAGAMSGGPPPDGGAMRAGGPQAGDRYLNSLRDWWRSSGTTSQMPIAGVSSATRAAGTHEVVFPTGKAPLNELAPGKYQLIVEVAREVKGPRPAGAGPGMGGARPEGGPPADGGTPGERGRGGPSKDALEEVRVAFDWPVKKVTVLTAAGKAELGNIVLTLKP